MVLDSHTRLQGSNETEPRNLFGLPLQYLGTVINVQVHPMVTK